MKLSAQYAFPNNATETRRGPKLRRARAYRAAAATARNAESPTIIWSAPVAKAGSGVKNTKPSKKNDEGPADSEEVGT